MKGDGDTNPALHEWENLHASAASATRRMRVHRAAIRPEGRNREGGFEGGWLYQTATCLHLRRRSVPKGETPKGVSRGETTAAVGLAFVPDPAPVPRMTQARRKRTAAKEANDG